MVRNEYKEIFRLREMLENEGIPFEFVSGFINGAVIAYPNKEKCVCSAFEHDGSYGRNWDKIEIMWLLTEAESEYDNVVSFLTAEDVFNRIKTHYQSNISKFNKFGYIC